MSSDPAPSGAPARAHLFISGRVQGVFYRATAYEEALRRGLAGWVRNTADGRVEMALEGDRPKIEDMIRWCFRGPPGARVDGIDADWKEPRENLENFIIRHGYDGT